MEGTAMLETMKEIAERLKGLRDTLRISAADLAKRIGLPAADYARYEEGTADIPVGVLIRVAGELKVELTSLLTGADPRLAHYCLVRKGEGVSVERRSDYLYQSLAFNFIRKKAEPFLVMVEPDDTGRSAPANVHPGQEFDYCLSGRLEVTVGGHALVLEEGDSLYFDSSLPHGMKALGNRPARFIAVIT
jgi:transcriptional regulator with XRE-family HTH domain